VKVYGFIRAAEPRRDPATLVGFLEVHACADALDWLRRASQQEEREEDEACCVAKKHQASVRVSSHL
jgi:hypothetical protein